jgi:hypothetical protein
MQPISIPQADLNPARSPEVRWTDKRDHDDVRCTDRRAVGSTLLIDISGLRDVLDISWSTQAQVAVAGSRP